MPPQKGYRRVAPLERFQQKYTVASSGCWEWNKSVNNQGYGVFSLDNRMVLAHRFAYENLVGPIPSGKELDHLCCNTRCVNPAHLEPATHLENVRRGQSGAYLRARTHCPQGHPYSAENTYTKPTGSRQCKACRRVSEAKYRAKVLAARAA